MHELFLSKMENVNGITYMTDAFLIFCYIPNFQLSSYFMVLVIEPAFFQANDSFFLRT